MSSEAKLRSRAIRSRDMFDRSLLSGACRAPMVSTISFAVALCFIYGASTISNISLYSTATMKHAIERQIILALDRVSLVLLSKQQEIGQQFTGKEVALVPPSNVINGERTARFQENPSNNLQQNFSARVLEFFDNRCKGRFFMTWFSLVKNFRTRGFLAVNSLFKAHRNGCLIIISKSLDSKYGYKLLRPLIKRGFRILSIRPDLPCLVKDTPAEAWHKQMKSGDKVPGRYFVQNLSNLIRLLVLYQYGGVYIDMDFIVLRDMTNLSNSIGAQSIDAVSRNWTRLNGAVMIFEKGHPLLLAFLREFALTYDGDKWGHNGPYLVSRVVKRLQGRRSGGYNFTILQPDAFYPVGWKKIGELFRKPENESEKKWVKKMAIQLGKRSYGVHLWNRNSSGLKIEVGSVLHRLISIHCVVCGDRKAL